MQACEKRRCSRTDGASNRRGMPMAPYTLPDLRCFGAPQECEIVSFPTVHSSRAHDCRSAPKRFSFLFSPPPVLVSAVCGTTEIRTIINRYGYLYTLGSRSKSRANGT